MCKHKMNWKIIEDVLCYSVYDCEDGLVDTEGVSETDGPTGIIRFHCHECGFLKEYNRFSKRLPKYISRYLVLCGIDPSNLRLEKQVDKQ